MYQSKILTHVGEVAIKDIKDWHLLWDGVEWVSHGGLIYKGKQEVITYDGVTGTPDHRCYTQDNEQFSLRQLTSSICSRPLAVGAINGTPVYFNEETYGSDRSEAGGKKECSISGTTMHRVSTDNMGRTVPVPKKCKRDMPLSETEETKKLSYWRAKPKIYCRSRSKNNNEGFCIRNKSVHRSYTKDSREKISTCRTVLQRVPTKFLGRFSQYKSREINKLPLSKKFEIWWRLKSQYIRRALRCYNTTMQSGYSRFQPQVQRSWDKMSFYIKRTVYQMGIRQMAGFRFQEYGYRQDRQQWALPSRQFKISNQDNKQSKQIEDVYDIIDSGPRHRFTCNGKIVSNCMSPSGLQNYAKTYGVHLSDRDAKDKHRKYFEDHPDVAAWHNRVKNDLVTKGSLRSIFGRLRTLSGAKSKDNAERAAAARIGTNFEIQNPASDLTLMGGHDIINSEWYNKEDIQALIFLHDALFFEVRDEKLKELVPKLKECMENVDTFSRFGYRFDVQFIAESEAGKRLSEMEKI